MSEAELQKKIKDRLTKHGWLVIKLIQTNINGIPDLLCIRFGRTIFLEVKTEKGIVSELQKHRIEQLNKLGIFACVVNKLEDIDVFCYKNL